MPLVVMREVWVFGGGERGSEMPSNSRVVMWSRAWPGVSVIWLIWVKVRVILEEVVTVVVGLIVVTIRGILIVLVLRVSPFVVIDGIVRVKDGFVLVVVDHHAADHTAGPVADQLVRAGVERWVLGD